MGRLWCDAALAVVRWRRPASSLPTTKACPRKSPRSSDNPRRHVQLAGRSPLVRDGWAIRCRPRPPAGRWRSPGGGRAGTWRALPRPRCSTRSRDRRCGHCRASRSCWPRGRRRRSARTSTPRWRRCCTRCRGGTSARPPTCASPPRWCSSSSAGS